MKTKTFLQIACLVWAMAMPQLMQAEGYGTGNTTNFAGGMGTSDDPFLIETIGHLNSLRTSPYYGTPNYYFELIADINLAEVGGLDPTSGWLPIPAANTAFNGHFNGGNHTIYGVWINRSTASNGFFSRLEGSASVENLNIVLDNTKGGITGTGNNVGGIAGVGNGNVTISNCSVTGNVKGVENVGGIIGISNATGNVSITNSSVITGNIKGNMNVGGIIGVANGNVTALNITNCSVTGSSVQGYVNPDGYGTGGLIGTVTRPCTLEGCSVSGTVLGQNAASAYIPTIGGLIGFSYSVSITDCHAEVAVTGLRVVGGFIGRINTGTVTITNSSASGDITAITGNNTSLVGGIVGFADGTSVTLGNTHYTGGTVHGITNGNNDAFVGGLIGRLGNLINCTINNSSAKGFATSLRDGGTTYAGIVGGFIGGREGAATSTTTIQKSYAANTVSGAINVGGFIGFIPNTSNQIAQSYAAGTVNGTTNVGGFVGGVSANASLTISESYATNRVNNTGAVVGGFIGKTEDAGAIIFDKCVAANSAILGTGNIGTLIGLPKADGTTVTNSLAYDGIAYSDGKTPNANTATLIYNATPATLSAILDHSTYSAWNLTVWEWPADLCYTLPLLKGLSGQVSTLAPKFVWLGINDDWTDPDNWESKIVPYTTCDSVIINKLATDKFYPSVPSGDDDEGTTIGSIQFKAGAEIANQQNLADGYKAFIQYDFSSNGLARGQWHMLSNPLKEVYSGDFTFAGYPRTYVRKFVSDATYGGWVDVPGNDTEFTAGQGFAYWVRGIDEESDENGLKIAGGIIDLPYFERGDAASIHPAHEYNSVEHESTFYYYSKNGAISEISTTDGEVVTRSADAYKLADATVTEILEFTEDEDYGEFDFALAGNPFMTTINFNALQTASVNTDVIAQTYLVWTKVGDGAVGFAGYNTSGSFGITTAENEYAGLTQYIAPQQSFIVVKAIPAVPVLPEEEAITEGETASLTFDIATVSATGAVSTLRSAKSTDNKLDIIAHNETADVLTFVANREGGQSTLSNKDSRKLLAGLSQVPEIYTLKTNGDNQVAVGANIIGNEDAAIPLVIATAYSGKLTLTFKGMDSYDADIKLIDLADNNKEYPLTGASFEKEFDFVPNRDTNNEVVPTENRFLLQFTAKVTGLEKVQAGEITVYNRNKEIQVVSSDRIQQIQVYNAQGQLVYTNAQVNAPVYTINRSALINGVCIVKVTTEKGSKNVKTIVK